MASRLDREFPERHRQAGPTGQGTGRALPDDGALAGRRLKHLKEQHVLSRRSSLIKLDELVLDAGTQPRVAMDQQTIDEYGEEMRAGAKFPPVTVFLDGERHILADGFHRVAAARQIGSETIDADVHPGTARDAILYSVGANSKHGLRRTNEDKRSAIERLLRDPEWVQWSNAEIARLCAVSDKTVARVRQELEASSEIPKITERKYQRDGQTVTLDTEGIGKPADGERIELDTSRLDLVPGLTWFGRYRVIAKQEGEKRDAAAVFAQAGPLYIALGDGALRIANILKSRRAELVEPAEGETRTWALVLETEAELDTLQEAGVDVVTYRDITEEALGFATGLLTDSLPWVIKRREAELEAQRQDRERRATAQKPPDWLVAYRQTCAEHEDAVVMLAIGKSSNLLVAFERHATAVANALRVGYTGVRIGFDYIPCIKVHKLHGPSWDILQATFDERLLIVENDDSELKSFVDNRIATTAEYRAPMSDEEKQAAIAERMAGIFPGAAQPEASPPAWVTGDDKKPAAYTFTPVARFDMSLRLAARLLGEALDALRDAEEAAGPAHDQEIAAYLRGLAERNVKPVRDIARTLADPNNLTELRGLLLEPSDRSVTSIIMEFAWEHRPEAAAGAPAEVLELRSPDAEEAVDEDAA